MICQDIPDSAVVIVGIWWWERDGHLVSVESSFGDHSSGVRGTIGG